MADGKASTPSRAPRIGPAGVPILDSFDYEQTSTRQTDTNIVAPLSTRTSARAVLTVVAGADAGRTLPMTRDELTIGRAKTCDLVLPDPGVSRTHARIRRSGETFYVEDLGSKNGTFVDVEQVTRRRLDLGEAVQIGPHALVRLSLMTAAEEHMSRELYDSSMRDTLTHAYNRRYFFDRLHTELAFVARHNTELTLMVCDFDHFKRINDTHGHKGGDLVLTEGVKRMLATLRAEDVCARIGGEEVAILLRGVGLREAYACAERVRRGIGGPPILLDGTRIQVTISIGVASVHECGGARTAEALFELADERLYLAKRDGRNRTVAES